MRLFHFSDDPAIGYFEPRPVRIPSTRPEGREWLNGPLVWAIDEWHQPMYLFPRDCPRILCWPTLKTNTRDREHWFASQDFRMIAYIESAWLAHLNACSLHRYELPVESFLSLEDAGMWVSHQGVPPLGLDTLRDLSGELQERGVELRVVRRLIPILADLRKTSLHVSAIRMRNAEGYSPEG